MSSKRPLVVAVIALALLVWTMLNTLVFLRDAPQGSAASWRCRVGWFRFTVSR